MKKFINRTITLFSICGVICFAVLMGVCRKAKYAAGPPLAHLPQRVLFKTINNSDNALALIGFELHEDEPYDDGETRCSTFNAIVRDIDPGKENYKSICKDIVADIIKTCGEKDVRINIYDSFEAYRLAIDNENGQRVLNPDEARFSDAHHIATYFAAQTSEMYNGNIYYLAYYPNAGNTYSEREEYRATEDEDDI